MDKQTHLKVKKMAYQLLKLLTLIGLTFFAPLLRGDTDEIPEEHARQLFFIMGIPVIATFCFLGFKPLENHSR